MTETKAGAQIEVVTRQTNTDVTRVIDPRQVPAVRERMQQLDIIMEDLNLLAVQGADVDLELSYTKSEQNMLAFFDPNKAKDLIERKRKEDGNPPGPYLAWYTPSKP